MNPIATITLRGGEEIQIELLPAIAPQAVSSFLSLANAKVFDGKPIQRIDPGKCIEPSYTAFGDDRAKYMIPNDAWSGTFLPVEFGTVMMGGYSEDHISGGEFVFPLSRMESWDGQFPVFGRVICGRKTLRRLENAELEFSGYEPIPGARIMRPKIPEIIAGVRTETFGMLFPEPEKFFPVPLPDNWK